MKTICITVGLLKNNTYILYSPETGKGAVVDPSGDLPKLREIFEKEGITPVAVLLTHGHFDHIMGVPEFLAGYPVPVLASENELTLLGDMEMNLTNYFRKPMTIKPDRMFRDGEVLEFPGFSLKVIGTPGHTEGSVCFYSEEDGVLVSGDTLFENAWGRTDFPTGNYGEIANSVFDILFRLPGETRVLPGHGNETTIRREKERFE